MLGHLLRRLDGHFAAAIGTVRDPDGRVEHPHVVVDVGHRADGGARVLADGLLLDGDDGREAIDEIYGGLLELGDKALGKGGQGLQEAPLSLGVDGLKGQGGLPGTAQTRDDDQLIAGNFDIQVLEIVFTCALDTNRLSHYLSPPS